jgi:multiple sugar transport system substrate-binding protein
MNANRSKLSRREFLRIAALSGAGLVATQCAPSTPEIIERTVEVEKVVTATPKAGPPPMTLSFWTWAFPEFEATVWKGVIEPLELDNPGAIIEYSTFPSVGSGGYEQKLLAAFASGTAPDIDFVLVNASPLFYQKGQLAPLDEDAAKSMGYNSLADLKASYWSGALDPLTDKDDTLYGVHHEYSGLFLYLRKDHFEEAGLDPLTAPLDTWDDVIGTGKKLVKTDSDGNIIREAFDLAQGDDTWVDWEFRAFIRQAGGSVLNEDYTAAAINSPEGKKALETWVRLVRTSGIGSPDVGIPMPAADRKDFAEGNQSMVFAHPPIQRALFAAMGLTPDDYVARRTPQMKDGKYEATGAHGWALGVNAECQNKPLAWDFIGRWTSMEGARFWLAEHGVVQPKVGILETEEATTMVGFEEIVWSLQRGYFGVTGPLYPPVAHEVRSMIERCTLEGTEVDESLAIAEKAINRIIAESG